MTRTQSQSLLSTIDDDTLTIDLLSVDFSEEMVTEIENLLKTHRKIALLVLDFSKVQQFNENALTTLDQLSTIWAQKRIRLVILAETPMRLAMEKLGLELAERAMVESNRLKTGDLPQMVHSKNTLPHQQWLDVFTHSINYAMTDYGKTPTHCNEPFNDLPEPIENEISAYVEFTTGETTGALILSFPPSTLIQLSNRILGEEFTTLDADRIDWAAEMLNLATALAQQSLHLSGVEMEFKIPIKIAHPETLTLLRFKAVTKLGIPFSSTAGKLQMEVLIFRDAFPKP